MSVLFTRRGAPPVMGKLLSDYAIGESVFLNVNGVPREFLVVNQGNPDSSFYDESCDGTWLLMKDIYEKRVWDSGNESDYENSDIHPYLNGTFLNLYDGNVQSAIKQVKLPYVKGNGKSGTSTYGTSGLSTKIFLLSVYEVYDVSGDYGAKKDGKVLDYFEGTAETDVRRAAYYSGSYYDWWLRTPQNLYTNQVKVVGGALQPGGLGTGAPSMTSGIRPALILPSTALFDPDANEFLEVK